MSRIPAFVLVAAIALLVACNTPASWADALNDIGRQSDTAGTVSACHRASGLKPDNSFAYSQVYARCRKVGVTIP